MWWLGFDCGHSNDYLPGMEAHEVKMAAQRPDLLFQGNLWSETTLEELTKLKPGENMFARTYKHIGYVKAEVEGLARQLAEGPRKFYNSRFGLEDDLPDEEKARLFAKVADDVASWLRVPAAE